MPKALDQEHKSALSVSARPVSFATGGSYTTSRDTTRPPSASSMRSFSWRSVLYQVPLIRTHVPTGADQ